MKENSLRHDVEDLVEQTLVAETENKVWSTMDRALSKLDTESRDLLTDYFNGATVSELSRKRGLNPREVQDWLNYTKRLLLNELRTECAARH